LGEVFGFVLAAFFKIAANASRVNGCIFFRVSSRGSKFFFFRLIDLLYHARRALRIGKAQLLPHSLRFAANPELHVDLKSVLRK